MALKPKLHIRFYTGRNMNRNFSRLRDESCSVAWSAIAFDTYAFAMALCMGVVAIAGVFLAIRSNFDPSLGPGRLIYAFEAVIIGGLGSLWGTLAGGIIIGVAQAVGARIDPEWQILAGHVAFLIVLVLRPSGLFPRSEH